MKLRPPDTVPAVCSRTRKHKALQSAKFTRKLLVSLLCVICRQLLKKCRDYKAYVNGAQTINVP